MSCKMETRKRASKQSSNSHKITKYACIVETHESTRKRLESTFPRNHEDHVAEKGVQSKNHNSTVRKFASLPQAMKSPDAKAAVNKEWEKLEKIPARQMEKVKSKKDVILDAQKKKKKVHFATLTDVSHLKIAE